MKKILITLTAIIGLVLTPNCPISIFYLPQKAWASGDMDKGVERSKSKLMIDHPELYLKVKNWNYYTVRSVFIIKNVTIENQASMPYKNIKVKVYYYSTSSPNPGQIIGSTSGVLPITVPPNSTETYLNNGYTLGAGSYGYRAGNLQVLNATPVL